MTLDSTNGRPTSSLTPGFFESRVEDKYNRIALIEE